jgi:hypothetical protein
MNFKFLRREDAVREVNYTWKEIITQYIIQLIIIVDEKFNIYENREMKVY